MMSTNCKYFVALLAAALLAVVATDAGAVTITNVTTGTTLFSDDFEGVAASPVGFADDTGATDFDPAAGLGTWTTIQESANAETQVSNFSGTTTGGGGVVYPSAAEGNNYLRLARTTPFNFALGTLSAPQTTDDDVIRVAFSLYGRGDGPDVIAFYENDPGTGGAAERFRLNLGGGGDIINQGPGDTGLNWIAGQWQTWEIDFVIGASTFDLTVDGVTASGLGTEDGSTFDAFRTFRLGSTPGVEFLVDAIPEPSSLLLAGMCLLGIATSTRRRTVS